MKSFCMFSVLFPTGRHSYVLNCKTKLYLTGGRESNSHRRDQRARPLFVFNP